MGLAAAITSFATFYDLSDLDSDGWDVNPEVWSDDSIASDLRYCPELKSWGTEIYKCYRCDLSPLCSDPIGVEAAKYSTLRLSSSIRSTHAQYDRVGLLPHHLQVQYVQRAAVSVQDGQ